MQRCDLCARTFFGDLVDVLTPDTETRIVTYALTIEALKILDPIEIAMIASYLA